MSGQRQRLLQTEHGGAFDESLKLTTDPKLSCQHVIFFNLPRFRSNTIHLTVSPCHHCHPFLSESHICSISHGACFPVFLKSEAIRFSHAHMLSITQQVLSRSCWKEISHRNEAQCLCRINASFFSRQFLHLYLALSLFIYSVSLTQYLTCTTTSWTALWFVLKESNSNHEEADRKWWTIET